MHFVTFILPKKHNMCLQKIFTGLASIPVLNTTSHCRTPIPIIVYNGISVIINKVSIHSACDYHLNSVCTHTARVKIRVKVSIMVRGTKSEKSGLRLVLWSEARNQRMTEHSILRS